MKKIKNFALEILYKPFFVFLLSLIFLFINLILDGTLFKALHLSHSLKIVRHRIEIMEKKTMDIEKKIENSSDPDFVEKEARQRLDYIGEGDLIFIFPEKI